MPSLPRPPETESRAPATPRRRRRWLRWALFLVLLVILLAGAAVQWFRLAARAAMPQLDGTLALEGLSAPVTVLRDAHGVPSISAQSFDDLFFAQGFVTAQDRMWQMDMMRRFAAGELAAALGADFVEQDRRQRVLGLRQVARLSLQRATPTERAHVEAYARGVNAYLEQHQYGLPLEMRVLRYRPRAWTAEDSLLVGAAMAQLLSHGSYLDDVNHGRTLERLGPQIAADLYPSESPRDILPGHPPELQESEATVESDKRPEHPSPPKRQGRLPAHRLPAARAGSNNWVLSGEHTASGLPLLSNDMHLPPNLPNTWYEAHLSCTGPACEGFDVAGVTLPGTPWVLVGHNRRIAWGYTYVGVDVQDVFVEHFNDAGEYQTPAGWRKPERRHEVIHVRRGSDVEMDVVVTRHGPIISDQIPGEKRRLALRWALLETGLRIPFPAINSAKNWQQFRDALREYDGPPQNAVYADVDGNIGYQIMGRAPIRASGDGSLPVSGVDDEHEWSGWVPFEAMPSLYNPPDGIIATANGRVVPRDFPYVLTREWEAPYRTERIYRMLRAKQKFVPADMLALQMDVVSELDRFVARRMASAIDQMPDPAARLREAAGILRQFDGQMSADSAGAAIEYRARRWLMEKLLVNMLGVEAAAQYHWFMETVWLENVVASEPQHWLPPQYSSWNQLLASAVEAAVYSADAPGELASWKYGDYATIEISHPIFGRGLLGQLPWLRKQASTGRRPLSGDTITVKQVGGKFAPSQRFTADLSDLGRSTMNIVNGQSGNLFSLYFNDQFEAWYLGNTFVLPFTPETVEETAAHRLTLVAR